VWEYIRRAEVLGLSWPVPAEIDDATLERRMFTVPAAGGHLPERLLSATYQSSVGSHHP
jgi:hypothetical protein